MAVLKKKVQNYSCDMDNVDNAKKSYNICLRRAWGKIKKQKNQRHENVIKKVHRARTFKKYF